MSFRWAAGKATNNNNKFSWNQVFLQWSLGMVVSTPIIAVLQGTLLLNDYRTKHSGAPRPVMPARGVAVAVEKRQSPFSRMTLNNQRPLHLLVVGDSLAAGVGISKSGTPVLPESIARALSQATGGRAVYWTCVGTPGISAAQIVEDIHQLEPQKPGRLEKLYKEWKAKRRKWQEHQNLKRRMTETEEETPEQEPKNYFREWWNQIRGQPEKTPDRVRETTQKVVQEWWKQVASRFRATKERVKEDLTEIRDIVQSTEEDDDEEKELLEANNNNNEERDNDTHAMAHPDVLVHEGNLFRRDSVNPKMTSKYDIAVVLMGLNDLKEAFMPHMTRGKNSTVIDGTSRLGGGLTHQLEKVLDALQPKMDSMDLGRSENEAPGSPSPTVANPTSANNPSERRLQGEQNLKRPLVVVPELPVAPLQLFQTVPLSWFLVPLFRAMESNKKYLSTCFPEYVIFIPQPDLKWWADVEAGVGPIPQTLADERLLLQSTDIALTAREKIQSLMKQHYGKGNDEAENDEENETGFDRQEEEHPAPSDHYAVQTTIKKENGPRKGSAYVASDKMHPNDEGYELWGRHIAAAIVQHWHR